MPGAGEFEAGCREPGPIKPCYREVAAPSVAFPRVEPNVQVNAIDARFGAWNGKQDRAGLRRDVAGEVDLCGQAFSIQPDRARKPQGGSRYVEIFDVQPPIGQGKNCCRQLNVAAEEWLVLGIEDRCDVARQTCDCLQCASFGAVRRAGGDLTCQTLFAVGGKSDVRRVADNGRFTPDLEFDGRTSGNIQQTCKDTVFVFADGKIDIQNLGLVRIGRDKGNGSRPVQFLER